MSKKHSIPLQAYYQMQRRHPTFSPFIEDCKAHNQDDCPEWTYLPDTDWITDVGLANGIDRFLVDIANFVTIAVYNYSLHVWGKSKGIYRFNPILADELLTHDLEGELPYELLFKMPELCVWIDPIVGELNGALMTLQNGPDGPELSIIEIEEPEIGSGCRVVLDGGTLEACIQKTRQSFEEEFFKRTGVRPTSDVHQVNPSRIRKYVNLLLYICSATADFGLERPEVKTIVPEKRRFWRPVKERVYTLGERVGRTITRNRDEVRRYEQSYRTPTGSRKRPHVRAAHWQWFRRGSIPLKERPLVHHWIPMILVNKELGETGPTIHQVAP